MLGDDICKLQSCELVKDVSNLQQISNTDTSSSDSQCVFTKLQKLLAVANSYTVVEHSLSEKKKRARRSQ